VISAASLLIVIAAVGTYYLIENAALAAGH
jgi:hypothetical protein